jgi:hypothetical protein
MAQSQLATCLDMWHNVLLTHHHLHRDPPLLCYHLFTYHFLSFNIMTSPRHHPHMLHMFVVQKAWNPVARTMHYRVSSYQKFSREKYWITYGGLGIRYGPIDPPTIDTIGQNFISHMVLQCSVTLLCFTHK